MKERDALVVWKVILGAAITDFLKAFRQVELVYRAGNNFYPSGFIDLSFNCNLNI